MRLRDLYSILFSGALLPASGVLAGEGVSIQFSGRDGRPVRFDFSRRETLIPPELQESRVGGSSGGATFLPLVDPAVTPNSGQRRRQMMGDKPERDWIFKDPDAAAGDQPRDAGGLGESSREAAMMKFMRGGEPTKAAGNENLPDEEKSDLTGRDEGDSGGASLTRRDKVREFPGLSGKREPFWSRLETEAGLSPASDGATLRNFFQAEQHRERELRHQEKMSDFRQMLNNPFAAPNSGSGSGFGKGFGAAPDPSPGIAVSSGMPDLGRIGGSALPGIDMGRTAGMPSAFDTPKVPADFSARNGFEDRKPEPIRRQIKLDIPKRDF